eukprot:TRINITY_DN9580_c0_g1_i4.p1 TRINITY_DN9580_c0_g1~~TRINITY_DN9580_c0_g1_i4.p1  ORF type:complete len:199 (-),score=50.32 TRINITY_DN9580_c0_g1_i4:96-692(-)
MQSKVRQYCFVSFFFFFFQAEDGIRDHAQSRGLGDVYKRQIQGQVQINQELREVEQDPKDYNYPLQKVFDVYQHMNKCYFYDSGYMGQLKEYKNLYYDPNKSKQFLYSQNKKTGVRYHDNFYEDFYKYLHENDVNELFFNKFGKKYVYDEDFKKIKTEMQFNPKIAPAHLDSTLKYQQTLKLKTELQKTKQQIPYKQQ